MSLPEQGRSQPSPTIGYVASVTGIWLCDGEVLKLGQAVPAGGKLALSPGSKAVRTSKGSSITVVLLDGTPKLCDDTKTCQPLPQSLGPAASLFARLVDVFQSLFLHPEQYSSLISRGDAPRLPDGVAGLQVDGQIALAPFFEGLTTGAYRVTFDPVVGGTPTKQNGLSMTVDWNGHASSVALPTAVAPGLYKVRLGSPAAPGPVAWILVTDAARYPTAHDAFAGALRLTQTWGTAVGTSDVERFLHAFLMQLALEKR